MKRFLPPFVLADCLRTLQHAWALAPVQRSAAARVEKKKKAHVVTAQAQARARAGPAREGTAESERGSDGPPAPGPLGTVVFVKKHASCFGCHGLADPPKQANGITQ